MYCLRPEAEVVASGQGNLTNEHIIPQGLSGTLVLPKSVCSSCQSITGRPEGRVMQTELLHARRFLNLKRKHPKRESRPLPPVSLTHFDVMDPNAKFDVYLDVENHPKTFQMYETGPAGLLVGENILQANRIKFYGVNLGYNPLKEPSAFMMRLDITVGDFAYFIAKIAYSYAVAEGATQDVDCSVLRDVLLERSDQIFNYSGSALDRSIPVTTKSLHWLSIQNKGDYRTVRVTLFASFRAPTYEVVLGRTGACGEMSTR